MVVEGNKCFRRFRDELNSKVRHAIFITFLMWAWWVRVTLLRSFGALLKLLIESVKAIKLIDRRSHAAKAFDYAKKFKLIFLGPLSTQPMGENWLFMLFLHTPQVSKTATC